MDMKKKRSIIFITIFMAVLLLPSAIWAAIKSSGNRQLISAVDFDLGENRRLSTLPDSFSPDTIASQLDQYYCDHVPFRSVIIRLNSKIDGDIEDIYRQSLLPAMTKLAGKSTVDSSGISVSDLISSDFDDSAASKPDDDNGHSLDENDEDSSDEWTVAESVDATCTEDGYQILRDKDGNEKRVVIKATGHDESVLETTEASYASYGHTVYVCSKCGHKRWGDFKDKLVDDSYLPPIIENDQVILGRDSWLFYSGNDSVLYYTGSNVLSDSEKEKKLALMQKLQDVCDEKGIKLVFMVFPNKEQVYPEYMPTYEIENEVKREEDFAAYVKENSDISFIYPLNELKYAKLYYDTYYPYDTHWNYWGAFVGTQALYKELGVPQADYDNLDVTKTACLMRGLVTTGALDPTKYNDDFDFYVDYKPEVSSASAIHGIKGLVDGYTPVYQSGNPEADVNKSFVMLGDSFRISMIDYIEKDFSFCTFVQRDNIDQAQDAIKNADILVVSAVERFDWDIFYRIPTLIEYISDDSED